ncbi:MAG: RNA polymerase sigma factor SigZ [Spirochaetia bacterium]|nr:RNA polymerase sigma factor SigZ [Spirochaetia bacterium]
MNTTDNIWNEYHAKLGAFINSKVSEDAAEDLLQDVFVKIHTRIDTLKESIRLESWLYQITRNTIIDHYRLKQPEYELSDWSEQNRSGELEAVRKELSLCLEPMIKELPAIYREAVQLSELENKTQREIAEMNNISLSGAKSRVQRGRAILKNMLQNCCQIEINQNNQLIAYEKKEKDCKYC